MLHARRLEWTLREAMQHPGFGFVEIIAPCSTAYARWNPEGRGLDPESLRRRGLETLKYYQDVGTISHDTHPKDAGVVVNERGLITEIIEGKFLDDPDKPDLQAAIDQLTENPPEQQLERSNLVVQLESTPANISNED